MKLRLNNILKIEDADIEIGGLTVLTGENNSGKSTVGKILFTTLKAVNNVRQVDKMRTVSLIRLELAELKRMFHRASRSFILDDFQSLSVNMADGVFSPDELLQILENEAEERDFTSRQRIVMRNRLARINQYIAKLDNPEMAVREEFDSIAKTEFMEPLNSYGEPHSLIHFHDDTTDAGGSDIEIKLYEGQTEVVRLNGNSTIEDITYIETPLYLHILNTLRLSSPIPTNSLQGIPVDLRKDKIPYHLADMAEKILSGADELPDRYNDVELGLDYVGQLKEISGVIGGEFRLNDKTKQLSFHQNGHVVPPISVASGIKSFGLLQRLIQTGNVSPFKILIWDEPENHLHPEWQVVFSRLIIELVSKGNPVVVSSHSPYFVQALRYFASAKGIEKDVRYYMAEEKRETGLTSIKEVTEDLNQVFTRLAAPLREIMNVDAVRNSMK